MIIIAGLAMAALAGVDNGTTHVPGNVKIDSINRVTGFFTRPVPV